MKQILEEWISKPVSIQVGSTNYTGTISKVIASDDMVKIQNKFYYDFGWNNEFVIRDYFIRISSIDVVSRIVMPEGYEVVGPEDIEMARGKSPSLYV